MIKANDNDNDIIEQKEIIIKYGSEEYLCNFQLKKDIDIPLIKISH